MSFNIAFLSTPTDPHNDNHIVLPQLFSEVGWSVVVVEHEALRIDSSGLLIGDTQANQFDLIWPIGFGPRATFFDRMQLLNLVAPSKLITATQAYLLQHSKTAWLEFYPPTTVAKDHAALIDAWQAQAQPCVLKPVAGSLGRDVTVVRNAQDIINAVSQAPARDWMLQPYLADVERGEVRTLVCGEQIIGSYLRQPKFSESGDIHANMAQGATAAPATLSKENSVLVDRVHAQLQAKQVGFASIDTVGDYLMEVNIANPGGFSTMSELYGSAFQSQAKRIIVAATSQLIESRIQQV